MKIFDDISYLSYQEVKLDLSIPPFEAFKKFYKKFDNVFFLESLGIESQYARYSYIGFDPLVLISAIGDSLQIKDSQGLSVFHTSNPYQELAKLQKKFSSGLPHGFAGGLVGCINYEGTRFFEEAFVKDTKKGSLDFQFGLYLDGFVFDRLTLEYKYFYLHHNRLAEILPILHKEYIYDKFSFVFKGASKTRKQYRKMFGEAKKHIKAGDIFQIVLSIKNKYKILGDPILVYQALREINPSPNMFFLKFGKKLMLGASPELLVETQGLEIKHMGTLAGTIKRGKDNLEDEKLVKELLNNEKEVAEHMMLVDLARNDMGRICQFNSIKINDLMKVKKFSHVSHLSTEIHGLMLPTISSFDVLASCFPAGTLTGAPKVEAMKLINILEDDPRGPYGGVVGYFSLNGDSMFCINIRSLSIQDDEAISQSGSGIVYDSDETKEYQEIINKGKSIKKAMQKAKKLT